MTDYDRLSIRILSMLTGNMLPRGSWHDPSRNDQRVAIAVCSATGMTPEYWQSLSDGERIPWMHKTLKVLEIQPTPNVWLEGDDLPVYQPELATNPSTFEPTAEPLPSGVPMLDDGAAARGNGELWPERDRDKIRDSLSGQQLKLFNVLWAFNSEYPDRWKYYSDLKALRAEMVWRGQPDPTDIEDKTVFEALRKLQQALPPESPYLLTIENESCRAKLQR